MEIIQIHGKDILKFVKQSVFKWLRNIIWREVSTLVKEVLTPNINDQRITFGRRNVDTSIDTKYEWPKKNFWKKKCRHQHRHQMSIAKGTNFGGRNVNTSIDTKCQ